MERRESILSVKEYGRVNLKLREYMDARGMTRNNLARSINARFEVVDKWYNNDIEKMDLDILARICFILNCSISDLLEYEKPENEQ